MCTLDSLQDYRSVRPPEGREARSFSNEWRPMTFQLGLYYFYSSLEALVIKKFNRPHLIPHNILGVGSSIAAETRK